MALSLQLGYPDVPKSITNPDTKSYDLLDNNNPMPFLTFIKIINVSFEPDSLYEYYSYYVKSWNTLKSKSDKNNSNSVKEKYREFIKDISLNYTTNEEKQFLSKIDFDDPYDLDIAIGFYGKKLKELALYYNHKRDDIKFNVVRNKLKGTNFGIEKTISELIISYLKNLDDGKILFDVDQIKNSIEIEIDELYDTYPSYFNQTPNSDQYDRKDLDYGFNIFLDDDATTISKHLSGYSDNLKILKETDQLFDNKRKLTQKYLSTDFYYLSTGSVVTQSVSGKLFKADNPINNLLNRDYPSTVSTELSGHTQSTRSKGFFRPHNTSIVLVDGQNSSFSINLSSTSPNSLYFFPDPNMIGVNGDLFTFIVDDSRLKNNFSSSNAVNQPSSNQFDTKYNGYVSKIEPNVQKYLDTIFENGDIKDSKKDIYNNLYGLFKRDIKFGQAVTNINPRTFKSLIVNGHLFYDDIYKEGYNYNWNISDTTTFKETTRSGISLNTGGFISPKPALVLYFGKFDPYIELVQPTDDNLLPYEEIFEGGYFTKSDYTLYDDSITSDVLEFSSNTGSFYYTELIDGGVSSSSPLKRAIKDPLYPSLSGNLNTFPNLNELYVVDGSRFELPFKSNLNFFSNSYNYENFTSSPTQFSPHATYDPKFELNGKIFVRNASTREVLSLIETFPYITSKFGPLIVSELTSKIVNFEISNDIIVIETQSYLIFNRILFENGIFKDPKSKSIQINHSATPYDKISNRFRIKNDIYYCKLVRDNYTYENNNFLVYPEIYKFDTINFKNTKIFPLYPGDITDYFNILGGNVQYIKSDAPILSYNSMNNVFNVSFLIKDQNNMSVLHGYNFHLDPGVIFLNHRRHNFSSTNFSNILNTNNLNTLNNYFSSGSIQYQQGDLII